MRSAALFEHSSSVVVICATSFKERLVNRIFVLVFVALASCALLMGSAHAQTQSAIDQFRSFVTGTQSARADFSQTVTDARGKVSSQTNGKLLFQRPGKFRWTYEKPEQVIVGDGKKVWLFDADLNQVTVRKLEAAFSSTPAALLAGRQDVEAAFTLIAGGQSEDMNWVIAEPKSKDAGIEKIRMGFVGADLRAMELADAFGNKTRINLSKVERNAKIDAKEFTFVPPKGADVVGDQ
jgi:outer membrane lipoprotein carrier protein